jgi:hypothetical protein
LNKIEEDNEEYVRATQGILRDSLNESSSCNSSNLRFSFKKNERLSQDEKIRNFKPT